MPDTDPQIKCSTKPQPEAQQTQSGGLRLAAPAKINLNLLVGPVRGDGFHPLDSIVAKITLYDFITLEPREDSRITFACEGLACGEDSDNLAYRAATLLAEGREVSGVDINLEKNIPAGGGLGGGSADAAVVLAGLNRFWNLGVDQAELSKLAATLGSDVPLFLGPSTCRMTGRGEIISPISVHPFHAVLVLPPIACPTGVVYRAYDEQPVAIRPQLSADVLAQPPSTWRASLINDLQPPAMKSFNDLDDLRSQFAAVTSQPLFMSGSGSTLFFLCDDSDEAERICRQLPVELKTMCRIVQMNIW